MEDIILILSNNDKTVNEDSEVYLNYSKIEKNSDFNLIINSIFNYFNEYFTTIDFITNYTISMNIYIELNYTITVEVI
jgi:hypothetical protein